MSSSRDWQHDSPSATTRLIRIASSSGLVLGVAVAGIIVWELVVAVCQLPPALLPTPRQVLLAAAQQRESLWRGTITTGVAATAGLMTAIAIKIRTDSRGPALFRQTRMTRCRRRSGSSDYEVGSGRLC